MANQDLQAGNDFKLMRKGPGDTDLLFVCLARTITFERTADSEEVVVNDCDDPDALPNTRTVKTSLSWAINFSGKSDPLRIRKLEDDYESRAPAGASPPHDGRGTGGFSEGLCSLS